MHPRAKGRGNTHRTGSQVLLSTFFPFQDFEEEDLPRWLRAGASAAAPVAARGRGSPAGGAEAAAEVAPAARPAGAGAHGARLSRPRKAVCRAASPAPFPWRDPELQTLPGPRVVRGHPGTRKCARGRRGRKCVNTHANTRRVGRHTHRHARPERGAHAHSPCSPVPPQKPLSRLLSAVSPLALPPNQPRVTLLAEHVPFSLDLCGTDSSGHQSPIFWPHCSQGIIKATHQAQPSPDWGRAGLKVAGQEIPRASRLGPRSMLPTTRRELHVGPRPLPRGESDR